ncbi:uncharacterized protein C8Q71DRAFT_799842 [Rhodofomes roseus]|uniref:DUF6570 domain-containing protein n=1 Tax=Rhodofomes roseus TaxID=34475 RepID=A0ABQ8JXW5_9APHY|nr:uncharacterized protein C8Q71DRAFT_799842 [Rhodofomes roseus]KAH9829080.1 hypothetical protein C8Q71DRAFT_799842 [Rhodofomes roseus]
MSVLQVHDPWIIQKCIVQQNSNEFLYGNELDGFMLDKKGLLCSDPINHRIALCSDCYNSLKKPAMPRYALANNLYRGHLPTEFCDLTWVEEMACAIYHITAHVTCLYGSSEPGQPKIFHGNTITHDMYVISTTTVLPRTPADITGYLSVVFIGPHQIKASDLGNTFRVQKAKIWHYSSLILLDQSNIDQFPDDGVLPGVDAQFIQDIHQKSVSDPEGDSISIQ